jgi:exopolysaccharide biosynthesis polyprenyl glycosylphosphotransferase
MFSGTLTGLMLLIVITYFAPQLSYSRGLFPIAAMTILIALTLSRIGRHILVNQLRKRGIGVRRVLIVGAGEVGRAMMRSIVAHPELGYQVIGFVDDNPTKGQTDLGKIKALGGLENLTALISHYQIDLVITALPWMYHRKILRIVHQCEGQQVRVYIVPDLLQTTIRHVDVEYLGEVPVVGVRQSALGKSALLFKRVLDLVLTTLGLIVGGPLMLLISILIKLDSSGPAIFAQTRIGKNGIPFTCFKFRTMRQGAEKEKSRLMGQNEGEARLFKIKDDPRVTRVGRFLRKSSLDELPQMLNVLRGEMSIVGPRPQIPSEVELYLEWHRHRLDVLPGITGMWQVSGRSELGFDEMALLDIWYVENWTPWLDIKILLKSIGVVLTRRGAY